MSYMHDALCSFREHDSMMLCQNKKNKQKKGKKHKWQALKIMTVAGLRQPHQMTNLNKLWYLVISVHIFAFWFVMRFRVSIHIRTVWRFYYNATDAA